MKKHASTEELENNTFLAIKKLRNFEHQTSSECWQHKSTDQQWLTVGHLSYQNLEFILMMMDSNGKLQSVSSPKESNYRIFTWLRSFCCKYLKRTKSFIFFSGNISFSYLDTRKNTSIIVFWNIKFKIDSAKH